MKNKIAVSLVVLMVVFLAILGIRFIFGGPEDSWICQNGQWVKHGNPSALEPQGTCDVNQREANIILYSPKVNETVGNTFTVKGKARVFENQFNVAVFTDRIKLYEGAVTSTALEAGEYGDFEKQITIPDLVNSSALVLQVFDYSAKDGSVTDLVQVPLLYKKSVDTMEVKVYFNNTAIDPNLMDCSKVYPVTRTVAKTPAVARAAIDELLKGTTEQELKEGFASNIQNASEVKIQSLAIDDGVAKIDFNDALEKNAGGSCRVLAIRSQITNTLKQFPTVKSVIISIDGKTDGILQP